MNSRLFKSLPFQLMIAALLAWGLASILPLQAGFEHSTAFKLLMLTKTTYIGLLKMLVGIVVLFSLLQGITSIGSTSRLKTLGYKTIAFYSLTSTLAICLGLGVSLAIPKWPHLIDTAQITVGDHIQLIDNSASSGGAIAEKLFSMALVNPFQALATTNLLAIVVFALLLGVALLASLPSEHPVFDIISGINIAINRVISAVIKLAPLAVFAIVFQFTAQSGNSIFGELLLFALLVFSLTLVHGGIVLPLLAKIFTGIKYSTLFRALSAPMAMAFATSSSSATLPLSLQTAQEDLGISQPTSSMVLPLGSIMNMDGTALFEGVAAIFLAQLYGIELGTSGLILIFIMAMVSSIGAPGMPSGSMSGMQLVLLAVGIPLEAIAILLIIERPLDTFRTAVNVEGDLIAALVVDKWQNQSTKV
ncbi:cation:dicarboxylase symporter family transporter [Photobacterium phosphoreum]|uniref:Cation:dicarboxylase symporter family transporter n=1 Tax=Photobacterium phosphoreum TaxID=659 RepID=A0AAW5A1S6_PHOPO|nr:dicarboxylate/amino acid:cation symporter [Photobacterium phosphoreum]KJF84578.1 Na+:H+ dicarboxylate symporter [Photobacterium phosphoreum]MCD9475950.1 cation:dicarboxylase symporter family transporter [Photobacterium phosphoreum]MCD9480661.1 cation:dicarboxylase symporter family transporter [Photobacterium phosphoreum]MCD9485160.1 cation:dicarboxylase symporter family transporter [Photobacterium phosphoreum]MCD9492710.1 cation:dicarboxylase symporter family transporter [Photobacterium pho